MTYMYPKMRERAKEGEAVHGEGRHQLQNEGYGKGKGKRQLLVSMDRYGPVFGKLEKVNVVRYDFYDDQIEL